MILPMRGLSAVREALLRLEGYRNNAPVARVLVYACDTGHDTRSTGGLAWLG